MATSFKQAQQKADSVTPTYLKTSELAFTKQPVCLVSWEKWESQFKGETTVQYKAHVIYVVNSKRQSGNIFLPYNDWFETLFNSLEGTQHNVYLFKQGQAYRMDQYVKEGCPCGHQHDNSVTEVYYNEQGEEVHSSKPMLEEHQTLLDTLNDTAGSITAKQSRAIDTLETALHKLLGDNITTEKDLEDMSERQAEKRILYLRNRQITG